MYETTTTTAITNNNSNGNSNSSTKNTSLLRLLSLHHWHKIFPTSLLALLLLLLLAYNGFTIFCVRLPFLAKTLSEPANLSPEKVAGETNTTLKWSSSSTKLSSSVMYAVKEENPPIISKTHLPLSQKLDSSVLPMNSSSIRTLKRVRKSKPRFKILRSDPRSRQFPVKVKKFFGENGSNSSCKVRFFLTWISSLNKFGHREMFTLQSLFNSHPNACVIIVSNSMDSRRGIRLLRPFVEKGFRVKAISPDFDYIFKDTLAEAWLNRLRKGNVDPGEVSLGQNLSNLLRLVLLYKFGGIYVDTDVIVLRSFAKLRNSIGAQTADLETGNWSRLNNAIMIFDKKHPLLFKFIEEFALTFNGNKWGHNGPYLVSRVVSRVKGRPGFNFTVLPPPAFYPVDWSRIHSLFRGPRDEIHSKWLLGKLRHIRRQSFAVHLWNRQSRKLEVEDGSIIDHIMSDCCVFCSLAV